MSGVMKTCTVKFIRKGDPGENSLKLDLDNDNDSILYDGYGNKISGAVTSQGYLYDGMMQVATDITWSIDTAQTSGVTVKNSGGATNSNYTGAADAWINTTGKVTVNGVLGDAVIMVRARYEGQYRYAKLTIKQLINADKYDLIISPNAVSFNTTTETVTSGGTIGVQVWRTPANGGARANVTSLLATYGLAVSVSPSGIYNNGTITVNATTAKNNANIIVTLTKDNKTQDSETIPINKAANGQNGRDGQDGQDGQDGKDGKDGQDGADGADGADGDSAPVAFATPDKIVFPCGNGGAVKTATTKSVIFSLKVGTNTATVTSVTSGTKPTGITVTGQADNAVTITASTSATAVGMASGVTFTVNGTYGGKSYSAKVTVALIGSIEGSKGYTGPSLRVQDWEKCTNDGTTDYQFYKGAGTESYKDVVLYKGYYYSCITSHSNKSVKPTNQTFWQLADPIEIIATNVLLSNYALIKNLGAEAIEMKDPNTGLTVFYARDGTVTCNTGNFYNVNVTGKVTAKLFYSPTKQLSVENFTNGAYNINPSSDPAHTFVLDHPIVNETDGGSLTINLPSATTYDGLELQFLEIRRTRSVIASVTLSGSITNGGTLYSNISSGYLKLNKFTVLKAMAGRWYVIQEELST